MRRNRFLLLLTLIAALLPAAAANALIQSPCFLDDGRVNARPHRDCGAPVAIFVQGNSIIVLGVDDQPGPDVLAASAPANGEIPTSANAIIGTGTNPVNGRPVVISRLTTGEYQVNTFTSEGTPYIVVWYKGREDVYHLDPVTNQPLDGAQPIVAPNAPNPSAGSSAAPPIPVFTTGPATTGAATTATTTDVEGTVGVDEGVGVPLQNGVMISMPAPDAVPLSNCQVTTTRIVRLRSAPEPAAPIMTRLPYRTTWKATERNAGWFRVIFENTQGWVSAEFLTTVGACDLAAPVAG